MRVARTERKNMAAADEIRRSMGPSFEERLWPPFSQQERRAFFNALPMAAAMIATDESGGPVLVGCNTQFDQFLGVAGSKVDADMPFGAFLDHLDFADTIIGFLHSSEPRVEFAWSENQPVGGRHFVVRLSRMGPRDGYRERALISVIDKTAQVETERSLRAEMLHDSLTGLPNRAAFNEAVEKSIRDDEATGGAFAVLVVDLTRFSRVNECMGSIAGDELIITVARRLVSALRAGDILARLGGDEFGILLRLNDGPGDALHAARRIQATLSTPFRLSELEIRVDCAVGCALMNDRVSMSEDLVRNAQFAMKKAKQSGRVEVYQPGEVMAARRRFSLETELRRAIEQDQLTLAYQPLIDLETNRVSGFEALARWNHPEHGEISPSEFIPVAEESGLIAPLGRWALRTATQALASWDQAAGQRLPIYMAVNVSAVQFQRDDVVAAVESALNMSGISGDRLKLELTESCVIADPERAMSVMRALKNLNVHIAMDDFGTGYSSLAYLQRLPIDTLKIDRSFVTGMLADRDSVAIVRAVLSLARALGMDTTAEGVETVELAQTLAALGCTLAQGYYFARPLRADDAYAYLRSRNA
jgi:diguanylate cyclase (GGDEF)-like protein